MKLYSNSHRENTGELYRDSREPNNQSNQLNDRPTSNKFSFRQQSAINALEPLLKSDLFSQPSHIRIDDPPPTPAEHSANTNRSRSLTPRKKIFENPGSPLREAMSQQV